MDQKVTIKKILMENAQNVVSRLLTETLSKIAATLQRLATHVVADLATIVVNYLWAIKMKAIDLLHDTEEMIESHKAIKKAVKYFIKEYGKNQMLDVIQDEDGEWILQPITHRHDVEQ